MRWPIASDRERALVGVALLCVLGLALEFGVRAPVARAWRVLDRDIALKAREMALDRQALAQRESIERAYQKLPSAVKKAPSVQNAQTQLLEELESLARRHGVKVIDVKPQTFADRAVSGAGASMVLETSWNALASFLMAVHQSPAVLQVQRASLLRSSDNNSLQAQLVITAQDFM